MNPTSASAPLTVDFFHDVVCSWCYVMSPRLRQVAAELGIQVRQRSFVLQDNREQMVQVFGSMERAKSVILGHWETSLDHEDQPRIDVEGMRAENFEYPSGLAGALACQAAHQVAGDAGHWDMFDAIQDAHLSEHRNIGDLDVLLDIAVALGHDRVAFAERMGPASAPALAGRPRRRHAPGHPFHSTLIVGADLARLQTTPLARASACWPRPRPEPDPPASEPPGSFLFIVVRARGPSPAQVHHERTLYPQSARPGARRRPQPERPCARRAVARPLPARRSASAPGARMTKLAG